MSLLFKNTLGSRLKGANWLQIEFCGETISIVLADRKVILQIEDAVFTGAPLRKALGFVVNLSGIELGGLSRKQASLFVAGITSARLSVIETEILQRANQLRHAIAGEGYLKHKRAAQFAGQADEILAWIGWLPEDLKKPTAVDKAIRFLRSNSLMSEARISELQQAFLKAEKQRYDHFFDTFETHPLTERQRYACLIRERANLVLAGAGTGKTSVMAARAGYLLNSEKASCKQILMLAFASKAARELEQRIAERLDRNLGISATTFHSLGRQIIGAVEGELPQMSLMADDMKLRADYVDQVFSYLLATDSVYQQSLISYLYRYQYEETSPFEYPSIGEYHRALADRNVITDRGEKVGGVTHARVANALLRFGVEYQCDQQIRKEIAGGAIIRDTVELTLTEYDLYIVFTDIDRNGCLPAWIDAHQHETRIDKLRSVLGKQLIECRISAGQGHPVVDVMGQLKSRGVILEPLPVEAVLATLREAKVLAGMSQLLSDMLSTAKNGGYTVEALNETARRDVSGRASAILNLLLPIYQRYQENLESEQLIDFDDMINKAAEYVRTGRFRSPWTDLLVDEFQDISPARAGLVRALLEQRADASVFAVGDDWQSIYRFTGSDLSLTTGFDRFFGCTASIQLDKTYRFNNVICEVASQFVMQNPGQLKKQLVTHAASASACVHLVPVSLLGSSGRQNRLKAITDILSEISSSNEEGRGVALLARYSYNLCSAGEVDQLKSEYSDLCLEQMTIHASKGREADYVVVLDLIGGRSGFPSYKQSHPLLEMLLPASEEFPYAEERRLMYVALTRAKHQIWLLCDPIKPSCFRDELRAIQGVSYRKRESLVS